MKTYERCAEISDLLADGREPAARDKLIELIDELHRDKVEYSPFVNHLLRDTGLYPYVKRATASWQDRFALEVFKVDVGNDKFLTLHREQSDVLRMLCDGKSVAVSAPTSFGKSFVIDAFIAIKNPTNVVIIVPTIALMDETRRRLYGKFWGKYNIITTSDAKLGERNIFVFPQERAIGYVDKIPYLDLLVIDEFYKASASYDKERSPALINAILKMGRISKQKYFLAPNITSIKKSPLSDGVDFVSKMDFNTVILRKFDFFRRCGSDEDLKSNILLEILEERKKSLVYAASYSQIDKISEILIARTSVLDRPLLRDFSVWIKKNYGCEWYLAQLVLTGAGVHNGQIHRSLSQVQLKLFDDPEGLQTIVSTSSIVEGVNTSAENVVIWKNRKGGHGNPLLDTFTYKNIIGRGGRMFRYFVGKVYLLEKPPEEEPVQLEIDLPDSILGDLDENDYVGSLTKDQVVKIIDYREYMTNLLGADSYNRLFSGGGSFQGGDFDFIKKVATEMKANPAQWNGLGFLNSDEPSEWDHMLYAIIKLVPPGWDIRLRHRDIVAFIKVIARNWTRTLPEILLDLKSIEVDVRMFFKLEKYVSFKLSTMLHDVNVLQKEVISRGIDVSKFVSKMANAFLPYAVYHLEEFGLPRMIARRIQNSGLVDFQTKNLDVQSALDIFHRIGRDRVINLPGLQPFDRYVLGHFLDGIGLTKIDEEDF